MTVTYLTNCPNCGDPIDVIEIHEYVFIIMANGREVTHCPVCKKHLKFVDGKLVAEYANEKKGDAK